MNTLNDMELLGIALLLAPENCADDALRAQISQVAVRERTTSSAGAFIHLQVPDNVASPNLESRKFSNLAGEASELANGFGGVLFVELGKLVLLEWFTFDEEWPSSISEFTLRLLKG